MLERQKVKAELIGKLNGMRGTDACVTLIALCNIMIQEMREENDHAQGTEVLFNQGKISILTGLTDVIINGLPYSDRPRPKNNLT